MSPQKRAHFYAGIKRIETGTVVEELTNNL